MQLGGSTVVVTGATGFTGSFVTARLVEAGARVRALVRRDAAVPGATTVPGDLRRPESLSAAVEGADAVVHCAIAYGLEAADAQRLTVEGTRALAEAARAAGCGRFVHMSTISVYDIGGGHVVDEDTPLCSAPPADGDTYGVSKAEAERVVAEASAAGLASVILRPPAILGAHPRCIWTVRRAREVAQGELTYAGDDRETLPYVFVENLADAVVLALENDAAVGGRYNVIDGHVRWRDYLERLAGVVGRRLEPDPGSDFGESGRRHYDGSRIRRELGYEPRVAYRQGMARIGAFLAELDLTAAAS